jgi:hypothetical protein
MSSTWGCTRTDARSSNASRLGGEVADRFLAMGIEKSRAVLITAKLASREEMGRWLSLDRLVGEFDRRNWRLGDILVRADYNTNGDSVAWIVCGPSLLIAEYTRTLQDSFAKRDGFYDLGIEDFLATPFGVGGSSY